MWRNRYLHPPAPAEPPTKEIAALLKKADKAFADDRLIEPKDVNALALYRKVLADDATNAYALAGIEKIHNSLLQQTADALDKGDDRTASKLIDVIGSIAKTGDDYTALQTRLKTLRQVSPLLTHAADLMQQGRTLTPPEDNALDVYRQVLKLDPTNKLADQGLAQIERDYLDRALAAAAQDDFSGADTILGQASAIRPGSQNLLDTRTRIEGIRHERAVNTLSQANSALDAGDPNLAELLAQKALGLSSDLSGVDEFNRKLRNARLYASFSPGQTITDKFLDRHGTAPPLIVVPIGSFVMGSPDTDAEHRPTEQPQREVKIETGFALGRDELTVGEFGAFIDDSSYATDAEKSGSSTIYDEESGRLIERRGVTWRDDYLGNKATDDLPVIHVSWNDATAYAKWLNARTGKPYRLPSEAEFEYALRAGSTTRYPWGDGNPVKPSENLTGDGDRSPRLKRSWAKAFPKYDDGYLGAGAGREISARCVRPARHGRQRIRMDGRLLARQLHARAGGQSRVGQSRLCRACDPRRLVGQCAGSGALVVPACGAQRHAKCARGHSYRARSAVDTRDQCAPAAAENELIIVRFCVASIVFCESRVRLANSATVWHVVRRNRLPGC